MFLLRLCFYQGGTVTRNLLCSPHALLLPHQTSLSLYRVFSPSPPGSAIKPHTGGILSLLLATNIYNQRRLAKKPQKNAVTGTDARYRQLLRVFFPLVRQTLLRKVDAEHFPLVSPKMGRSRRLADLCGHTAQGKQ